MPEFDALMLVSFGGPEGPDDVMPFLENVLRGKNVPRERMLEVSEHYQHFGGVSPINEQNRKLIAAIKDELKSSDVDLPVYWGNRNWHPLIPDTLQEMKAAGHKRILCFMTSAFSCYSGCRQYREDLYRAQEEMGDDTLEFFKIRKFFNHPGFVEPFAENVKESLNQLANPTQAKILFTAHSIPDSMADNCRYEVQLRESCKLVAEQLGHSNFELVFQSRSGPPTQPWLEPDVCDRIKELHSESESLELVIAPIGFVSDHMEVLFDLDTEAVDLCQELGIPMQRAATVGTHPRFVQMVRELIEERQSDNVERLCLGSMGPNHDVCPKDCCLSGRPAGRPGASGATGRPNGAGRPGSEGRPSA